MTSPGTTLLLWACTCTVDQVVHWLDVQAGVALDTGGEAAAIFGDVVGHFLALAGRTS